MRINEKNLGAFAVSTTPIDREGWLNKRGEVNKSFQKRWFILKGNLLFYFEKKGDKEPLGVIILEGCTIELAEEDEQFSFKIVFHGPGDRTYILCAESQDDMEAWMKALACASYDYMKLMVADLEKQLDELEATTSKPEECVEEPKAPPRGGRYNPFNKNTLDNNSCGPCSTSSQNVKESCVNIENAEHSFMEIHSKIGISILANREEYMQLPRRKELIHPSTPLVEI